MERILAFFAAAALSFQAGAQQVVVFPDANLDALIRG
jgi:hypothetical protein